jgi:ubiquinone/menaquinone biosynthesis C-methylase UbiE
MANRKSGDGYFADFSDEMLELAKLKVQPGQVKFIKADITLEWAFGNASFDLVSFSLVLEHIENLDFIFHEAAKSLKPGGHVYIGELHPYMQYTGTKARFTTEAGNQIVPCFNHHISEFIHAAKKNGLTLLNVEEYFDEDNNELPRILALIFIKNHSGISSFDA